MGKTLLGVVEDRLGCDHEPLLHLHHRKHFLLGELRGNANNSGLLYRRVIVEGLLDLPRRDVLSAPADRVLRAVEEREPTLGIADAAVPGAEPAIAKSGRGRLRHSVVLLDDHVRSARPDHDLARRTGRQGSAVVVVNLDLERGHSPAARAEPPLPRPVGDDRADLGRAVDLEQHDAEAPFEPRRDRRRRGRPETFSDRIVGVILALELLGQH